MTDAAPGPTLADCLHALLTMATRPLTVNQLAQLQDAEAAHVRRALRRLETLGHAARLPGRHTHDGRTPDHWTTS